MDLYDAERLAGKLMHQHGLIPGWRFRWDNAKRQAGITRHQTRIISLSKPIARLNPLEEVRDTILHEIAHALAGPGEGHGREWQRIAREIGGSGERMSFAKTPPAPYTVWCARCGRQAKRFRKSNKKQACPRCCRVHNGGQYSPDYLVTWSRSLTTV